MAGLRGLLMRMWYGSEAPAARSFTSPENPSTSLSDPAPWLINAMGGGMTRTGVNVTPETAMQLAAVYACVRNIAQDIAALPVHVKDAARNKRLDVPAYKLLHDAPNRLMTAMVWRETSTAHVLLWGNAYSEIEMTAVGMRPVALWPIPPWCVQPKLIQGGTDVEYRVTLVNGRVVTLPSWRMLHVPGLGFDGVCGRSVISHTRESIGLAAAAEAFGSQFFGNSSRPSGALKLPPTVKSGEGTKVLKAWNDSNQGLDNAARTALLMQGAEWVKMGLTNEEAQFLETRRFQVGDVARMFRMPPHMIGDLDKATFSNVEQQQLEYVMHTLLPWLVRFEQEYKRKLLGDDEGLQPKHNVDGLLRGDITSRGNYYVRARQWGWMSADDIREREDLPDLPDGQGKTYLTPLNMVDAADPEAGAIGGDKGSGDKGSGDNAGGTKQTTED
jgi:HK97 family phage portal protein